MPSEVLDGNADDRVGNCRHSMALVPIVTLYDSLATKVPTSVPCVLPQIARRNS